MFVLFHFACLSSQLCPQEESSALLHFKTQLITDITIYNEDVTYGEICPHGYPKMRTWHNGTDCCSWMGVTCHSLSGHVTGLDLSCSGLVGDIPSQISHLSELQSLDLSWNDGLRWKETILKSLLQNATALREIVLEDNDMSCISPIASPLSLIANMSSSIVTTLSLGNTGIRGHLTSHILCLPNLYELNLYGNENIQVYVPKLNCSTSLLSVLDLSQCQFPVSQIPSSFSNLTHLTSLYLFSSELNG
ncbi:hypothetical protein PIB30_040309 [Stylosanthes scabra]|uniref:Leucine-rich repeat-containing N-terminal plant-type domain-containing protein n=1 Tax=Stylosanthes scabra TaxID=79078 RepID=A0ABU6REM8_9FABA|nr:hypothetical protein [Stylosanthes scabra]